MDNQSQQDAGLQTGPQNSQATVSQAREDNQPSQSFHNFMMRHIGHQDVAHSSNGKRIFLFVIAIVLATMVVVHIFVAVFLTRTVAGGFLFENPLTYGVIGLLFVFAMFKFKRLWGFIRTKGNFGRRM